MSDALLNSYSDAFQHLRGRIYEPVFFAKLAQDYGIQPADAEEAQMLVNLAEHLRAAEGQYQQKVAGQRKSLVRDALDHLNREMGGGGLPPAPALADHQVKAAAAQLLQQQPDLRDAALLYRDYLAQRAAAQQAQQ